MLERVLGGQHQERLGQPEGLVADRDLVLLHRLQERALHLGRRAIDLVGEQQVGEHRPLAHAELARLRLVDQGADQVRRQQVRRELDPLMRGVQRLGERGHREGLGDPGHAFDQHVTVGEQADQQPFQHVALADDDLLHRPYDVLAETHRPRADAAGPAESRGSPLLRLLRGRGNPLPPAHPQQLVRSGSDLSQARRHGKCCRVRAGRSRSGALRDEEGRPERSETRLRNATALEAADPVSPRAFYRGARIRGR